MFWQLVGGELWQAFLSWTVAVQMTVFRGPLVEEVHQQFSPWVSQVSVLSFSDKVGIAWTIVTNRIGATVYPLQLVMHRFFYFVEEDVISDPLRMSWLINLELDSLLRFHITWQCIPISTWRSYEATEHLGIVNWGVKELTAILIFIFLGYLVQVTRVYTNVEHAEIQFTVSL